MCQALYSSCTHLLIGSLKGRHPCLQVLGSCVPEFVSVFAPQFGKHLIIPHCSALLPSQLPITSQKTWRNICFAITDNTQLLPKRWTFELFQCRSGLEQKSRHFRSSVKLTWLKFANIILIQEQAKTHLLG
ncbi:hypothetical protein FKM82_004182 [Ascaphus truei]